MASYPLDVQMMLHYRERAAAFHEAMQLLRDEPQTFREGPALLAVHAAISLTDSICACYTGHRGKGEAHREAVGELRMLCSRQHADDKGVKHLAWLLARKSFFAYEEHHVDGDDIEAACTHAERFQTWAFRVFPVMARGECDDD